MQSNASVTERTTDWNKVIWRKAHSVVRNLRRRIFRATKEGNLKKVRRLQRLLLRCYSNILISVRRVSQVNKGKYTPGVDGLLVKTPKARGLLVDILTYFIPWKPYPTRRTYIPKASGKKRPLGIPSLIDRCLQAIVKNALEPAWEAQFERINYGFRPGRSAHDAMGKIYNIARPNKSKKWVLDADIKGCFDNINHEHLMKAIGNFPSRKLIYLWLKAGYVEKGGFHNTEAGSPQGGIISPLLANIALHGMEEALTIRKKLKNGKSIITRKGVYYDCVGESKGDIQLVRYADDFVVFTKTREAAENAAKLLNVWLGESGLTLSDEKTRIVYLTEGFNFLGFRVKHYKVKNTRTGWKLLIKPSSESLQEKRSELRQRWLKFRGQSVKAIIKELNPYIRGVANYLRPLVSKRAFNGLDHYMFQREKRYANHTHPEKSNGWKEKRYWGKLNLDREDRWVFGDKQTGIHLLKFSWFKIERHTLVKGEASPDDPSLKDYWEERKRIKSKELTPSRQRIAAKQGFNCPVCGESLFNDESLHIHHIKPRSKGGGDNYANLQLVHLYCHQQLHAQGKAETSELEQEEDDLVAL